MEFLLYYLYDETGSPIGMQYRTSNYASRVFDAYFFEKNVQGDIIGVYNSTGKKIGAYTYDAWGKCSLSGANGNTILEDKVVTFYNPFRYRGYYYDYETGFYYLQSRYYNPEWGRFLNADITLESMAEKSSNAKQISGLSSYKRWNRKSFLSDFFQYVKVINDQIYILCEVMNWNGEAFAVVFKYDFNTEQTFYVMSEKISDRVSTNYAFAISEE